jgi:hypothetical protein
MADFTAIAAVGKSLERYLSACFLEEPAPVPGKTTRAALIRTEDFDASPRIIPATALSIFLYRVDFNKTMRAAWSAVGSLDARAHLPTDLHYLLTPWAENAEYEHRILGRAMECLESTPILSGPLLHPLAAWAANETIQVMLEEISTEAVMRIFDSLPQDYKLSVPYLARVVRVDGRHAAPAPAVTEAVLGTTASALP